MKFELGQEVKVTCSNTSDLIRYKKVTIIGVHLKSEKYYVKDYTVVIDGVYENSRHYTSTLKKFGLNESQLSEFKEITIYAYEDAHNEIHYASRKLSNDDLYTHEYRARPELDFTKEL